MLATGRLPGLSVARSSLPREPRPPSAAHAHRDSGENQAMPKRSGHAGLTVPKGPGHGASSAALPVLFLPATTSSSGGAGKCRALPGAAAPAPPAL